MKKFTSLTGISLMLSIVPLTMSAQWSGFGSVSAGYQSNPLYNYQHHGDQIFSAFLDWGYTDPDLSARYMGGLTLFNQLSERNYLEHGLSVNFTVKQGRLRSTQQDKEGDAEEETGIPDSVGIFGVLGGRLTARHDKAIFAEYDNRAAFLTGSYFRGYQTPWHIRIVGEGGYRSYPWLSELSNTTGLVTAEAGFGKNAGTSAGGWVLAGIRYYTSQTYDTTLYVTTPGSQSGKKTGSGKGGAVLTGIPGKAKQVLSNADEGHVGQLAAGLYFSQGWSGGSARIAGLYRTIASGAARILARTSENATINEDIYNDFFSYEGPEASLSLIQGLPFNIRATVAFRLASKRFSAPAFDLAGNQTADNRQDQHYGADIYISRYIPLSDALGMDLAVSGYAVRNASNDQYNDFHGWGFAVSIGAGF